MKSSVSTSDTLGLMLKDLDQFPMPDHEQQVELAKRVVAGDEAARKQMVAANLRLVVHWARRYQDRGVDMADLVQEGTFGLMRAVDKFDWERGFRFRPTPPGGSARPSSAPCSSTGVPSASPSKWVSRSSASS
jgi:RNA polymerase primary sigma factor